MSATAAFLCIVLAPPADGDTFACASGVKVRVAGVEANERRGGCHLPRCPTMPHAQAKATLHRLTYRQRLTCQPVGRSFNRIVASCRLPSGARLECELLRHGSVIVWEKWWRAYGLERCA